MGRDRKEGEATKKGNMRSCLLRCVADFFAAVKILGYRFVCLLINFSVQQTHSTFVQNVAIFKSLLKVSAQVE